VADLADVSQDSKFFFLGYTCGTLRRLFLSRRSELGCESTNCANAIRLPHRNVTLEVKDLSRRLRRDILNVPRDHHEKTVKKKGGTKAALFDCFRG